MPGGEIERVEACIQHKEILICTLGPFACDREGGVALSPLSLESPESARRKGAGQAALTLVSRRVKANFAKTQLVEPGKAMKEPGQGKCASALRDSESLPRGGAGAGAESCGEPHPPLRVLRKPQVWPPPWEQTLATSSDRSGQKLPEWAGQVLLVQSLPHGK